MYDMNRISKYHKHLRTRLVLNTENSYYISVILHQYFKRVLQFFKPKERNIWASPVCIRQNASAWCLRIFYEHWNIRYRRELKWTMTYHMWYCCKINTSHDKNKNTAAMKSSICWDIAPCSRLKGNWRFGETRRLHKTLHNHRCESLKCCHENYNRLYLLGYNAVYSVESQPTFRRKCRLHHQDRRICQARNGHAAGNDSPIVVRISLEAWMYVCFCSVCGVLRRADTPSDNPTSCL
jgi:hypothetical protein